MYIVYVYIQQGQKLSLRTLFEVFYVFSNSAKHKSDLLLPSMPFDFKVNKMRNSHLYNVDIMKSFKRLHLNNKIILCDLQ